MDDNQLMTAFQQAFAHGDMSFQFLDLFPFMVAIFTPDGTLAYLNRAGFEEIHVTDPRRVIGRYNILKDSVILDTLGRRKGIEATFRGVRATEHNLKFPSDHFNINNESVSKVLIQTVSGFPLLDEQRHIAYIALVLVNIQTYEGRVEIVRVLEYMNQNWQEDFNREKLAEIANLSVYHFTRMFKMDQGVTPQNYYKQIKIAKLCEKLLDPNLNITQAFSACGVDAKGRYLQYFKDSVGITPSEYRKIHQNKRVKRA